MVAGSPKASCKTKRKGSSIFTANRFKQSASNISSQDNLLTTIQQGHAARYPYMKKKYILTKCAKDGFKVYENGKIELSMGIHHGKREKPMYASHLPKRTIKEIECCWDQGLYLAVTYEDGQKAKAYIPNFAVGVDLGEVQTIGAFCENGKPSSSRGEKYAPFTVCGIKN
jgi:hypothetical protein